MTHNNKPITEEEALKMVKEDGESIQYINNPTEKVQLEAVRQNSYYIALIDNPSERLQLETIKYDSNDIEFINNPSEEVILKAARDIKEEVLKHTNIRRLRRNTLLELLLIIEDKEFDRFYRRGLKDLGAEELIERIERR